MRRALRTKISALAATGAFLCGVLLLVAGRFGGGIALLTVSVIFLADVSRSRLKAHPEKTP